MAAGPRSWVDGQHQHCGMSAAVQDEVYALATGHLTASEVRTLDAAANRILGPDDESGGR